jgi:hypothetical protein
MDILDMKTLVANRLFDIQPMESVADAQPARRIPGRSFGAALLGPTFPAIFTFKTVSEALVPEYEWLR